MKKSILTLAAVCTAIGMNAQMATVSAPETILKGIETDLYHPVLSADGQHIVFANADYTNLRTYDFESGVVTKVASDNRSALNAHFDSKGQLSLAPQINVRTEGTTLFITKNGVEKGFHPVDCHAGYLWESLSPDGTKVMFVAAGKGVFITDLEGNIVANPGKYEAPVWFGNDHILVQNTTDDGHQYSSSQILLLNLNGTESQAITRPESMTFSPTASFDSGRVVYTTVDGRLYQVNVKLNK